jgi:hypothetical protein
MTKKDYWCICEDGMSRLSEVGPVGKLRKEHQVWSIRMSTAFLGLVGCESGNRGPNSSGEVLLVIGLAGLEKAVELGFMCHASCLANERAEVQDILKKAESDWFDVTRVEWEKVINVTGEVPKRVYLPHKWRVPGYDNQISNCI